ncbi:MAG: hypothetical protein RLZ98_2765 [Pseudomonadota bacterium]|jgi:glycosyltransferase involved in cell wall biosynthesis
MRVTVIDGDVSYPPTSGKRLRTLNLLLGLADSFEITYIGRAETAPDADVETFFRDHRISPILVEAPLPRKHGIRFYMRLLANLASDKPYSVTSHTLASMRAAVQRHAASQPPDLWQLEWVGYDYCLDANQSPVVLQAHNVEALIWQRFRDVETNPLKRAYFTTQWRKMMAHEARIFPRVSRVIAVSREDAALARNLYGHFSSEVIENGVDTAYFAKTGRQAGSRTILFLGALDWRPNLDGIDFLLREIWPRVRMRLPDARLSIVGRHAPSGLVQRIATEPGATLAADVADVRPYMREAAAMAVPLRIGGGSRLKILEALAARLPVVSTTVGAEGLDLIDGTHFANADDPESFSAALVDALEHPANHARMAEAGCAHVAQHNDWSILADRLGRIWQQAIADSAKAACPKAELTGP